MHRSNRSVRRAMAAAIAVAVALTVTAPTAVAAPPQAGGGSALAAVICRAVDNAAAVHHLPPAFMARVLWQESRFRSGATSPAGAEGVAQFMPQVAAERGLADPREPVAAIRQAARLLAELSARFGNLGLAAAAYNAGPARVASWLSAQSELPLETRRYVLAVTGWPVDNWRHPPLPFWPRGRAAEPCLAVALALARRSPPLAGAPPREGRLEQMLARAASVLGRFAAHERTPLRAAEGLCDRARSLGAVCAVYER